MAGITRYALEARGIADEIADIVANDEAAEAAIETAVQAMTYAEWIEFRSDNAQRIAAIASATPSVRRRRSDWKTTPVLLLGAYQFCLEAACLLDAVDQVEPGVSYRDMLSAAGTAAQQVQGELNCILLEGFDGEPLPFRPE